MSTRMWPLRCVCTVPSERRLLIKSPMTAFALSLNEVPWPPPGPVLAAVERAARHANRYPDMTARPLAEAIAARLGVPPDDVVPGAGGTALLQQAMLTFAGGGRTVVYPWRSFEAYPLLAGMVGARSVAVPLDATERHDLDAMARAA